MSGGGGGGGGGGYCIVMIRCIGHAEHDGTFLSLDRGQCFFLLPVSGIQQTFFFFFFFFAVSWLGFACLQKAYLDSNKIDRTVVACGTLHNYRQYLIVTFISGY